MAVYDRCLYCDGGQAKVKLMLLWNVGDGIPQGFEMFKGEYPFLSLDRAVFSCLFDCLCEMHILP